MTKIDKTSMQRIELIEMIEVWRFHMTIKKQIIYI